MVLLFLHITGYAVNRVIKCQIKQLTL